MGRRRKKKKKANEAQRPRKPAATPFLVPPQPLWCLTLASPPGFSSLRCSYTQRSTVRIRSLRTVCQQVGYRAVGSPASTRFPPSRSSLSII
jgi:hypothetical protein